MTLSTSPDETALSLKDQKKQIDIEVRRAELELKKLELVKSRAEADSAVLSAERTEYSLKEFRRAEVSRLATEIGDRVYSFDDEVTDATVSYFTDWLQNRVLRFPEKDLTVYINSPGGSVYAGFVAMDAIREAQAAGSDVTVKITGMAASMAGVIAQAANRRLIGKNSELMIHTAASFQFGSYTTFDIEDQTDFLKRLTRKSLEAYAARSGGKWTADDLFKKVHGGRKDWWLDAEEAVEQGFMDGTF
jgi:ATP-dependent protease ClpP protease subunit